MACPSGSAWEAETLALRFNKANFKSGTEWPKEAMHPVDSSWCGASVHVLPAVTLVSYTWIKTITPGIMHLVLQGPFRRQ